MGKPGRPSGSKGYRVQVFIDAIPGSGGIISTIAKRVGCAWHTAKKYCTTYPTVAKVYGDECEGVTDLAESTVLKAIQSGDVGVAKWYLTMKAKNRGYAQRQEITGADGSAAIVVNLVGIDPDAGVLRYFASMSVE